MMNENMLNLEGEKYLVTGASSGIGQATAILISKLGGKVILNGRSGERLNQTYSKMEGEGHHVMPFDLTNQEGIKTYIDSCLKIDDQRLDGVVFAAGIGGGSVLRAENLENLQHIIEANFLPYFSILKACSSRRVLNDGGSIVKRLCFDERKHCYYLHPENTNYEDIYVRSLSVQGVARHIIKAL